MEKYINDYGKPCYKGVTNDSAISLNSFHVVEQGEEQSQYALHTNMGSITILHRLTGLGWYDTESGYRDTEGEFWLASGQYDVRYAGLTTMQEHIDWIKDRANTCIGNINKDKRADNHG